MVRIKQESWGHSKWRGDTQIGASGKAVPVRYLAGRELSIVQCRMLRKRGICIL